MKEAEPIEISRRRLLAIAGLSAGSTVLAGNALFADEIRLVPGKVTSAAEGQNTSFGPLKQIDAGLLSVGYAEAGPASGPAVILLHGWPYDIYSFVDVTPLLAAQGYRVIVPYLRGDGTRRLLSSGTRPPPPHRAVCPHL